MRLSTRQKRRESCEQQAKYRISQEAARREEEAKKQAAVEAALQRTRREPEPSVFDTVSRTIWKKTPRLLKDEQTKKALGCLQKYANGDNIGSWEPRGKGSLTVFRSLCDHLLARYPVPAFLYSVFLAPHQDPLTQRAFELLVVSLARGSSLYKMVTSGSVTVPLTRQMCHRFLQSPGDLKLLPALRRAQCNVRQAQLDAYLATPPGRSYGNKVEEAFWSTFLLWLENNPMLAPREIGPLVDYIQYRRREEPGFSMKGRGALALIRATQEWHGELAKIRALKGATYPSSGFKDEIFEEVDRYGIKTVWEVTELLSSKALIEEGRVLGHCVASYGYTMESGRTSIWSMACDGTKRVTIEVDNLGKTVRQVRGKYNRAENNEEFRILRRWAQTNGLGINSFR